MLSKHGLQGCSAHSRIDSVQITDVYLNQPRPRDLYTVFPGWQFGGQCNLLSVLSVVSNLRASQSEESELLGRRKDSQRFPCKAILAISSSGVSGSQAPGLQVWKRTVGLMVPSLHICKLSLVDRNAKKKIFFLKNSFK